MLAEKKVPKLLKMKVADFVKKQKRGSELLNTLGLPVRGNEDKTLMEVCTSHQRNEDDVVKELERIKKGGEFEYPKGIFSWSPELVVRYLEEEHHAYAKSLIRDVEDYSKRACDVHGSQYPELAQMKWYINQLIEKLNLHLKFQEQKFFPRAIKLFKHSGMVKEGMIRSLNKQIGIIEKDQQEITYFMKHLRTLSNNFKPPKEACTTFSLLYSVLEKLDEDLKKHHFLEEQYVIIKLKAELKSQ